MLETKYLKGINALLVARCIYGEPPTIEDYEKYRKKQRQQQQSR